MMRRTILLVLMGTFFTNCQEEKQADRQQGIAVVKQAAPVADARFAGNRKMAEQLNEIYRFADPEENYSLNSRMAVRLQQQFSETSDPNEKFSIKFKYAQQLLFAGHTEDAIRELNELVEVTGGVMEKISPERKAIFDNLGIAYLRLGEQQNCVNNHTSASCIIPLQPEGYHQLTMGSENAVKVYSLILNSFPDDLQSQWLLNVAHMTLGEYPDQMPAKWRISPEVFQTPKSIGTFKDVAIGLGLDVKGLSGGCSVEDFTGDGYLDIFATSYGLNDQCRFFINNGNGTFTDFTERAGLQGIVSGLNVNHVDYNNDGFPDILILRGAWMGKGGNHPNSLLRNNGDGTFSDVTEAAGLLSLRPTQTAAWADFNLDGWPDLFIGNESLDREGIEKLTNPCELYVNNGDGTFTEMAAKLGLAVEGMIKGVAWGDINNDHLPDLYVSDLIGKNKLFINRGGAGPDDWKFEEAGQKAGVQEPFYSFPAWFWDYDNDGYDDIFVSGYDMERLQQTAYDATLEYIGKKKQAETPRLYRNNGNETFTDVTVEAGLDRVMYAMGSNFGDLDNDGFLDFYIGTGTPDFRAIVPNRMFRNVAGKGFEEVTMGGFGHLQKGHGIAFGDLDNDGDQDIYCVMGGAYEGDLAQNLLYENPGKRGTSWINIALQGTKTARSAILTRIKVDLVLNDGSRRTIYRRVGTGGSFGASSLQQEIGLGENVSSIEAVRIYWPRSEEQLIEGPPVNSNLLVIEGAPKIKLLLRKKLNLNTKAEHSHHSNH